MQLEAFFPRSAPGLPPPPLTFLLLIRAWAPVAAPGEQDLEEPRPGCPTPPAASWHPEALRPVLSLKAGSWEGPGPVPELEV